MNDKPKLEFKIIETKYKSDYSTLTKYLVKIGEPPLQATRTHYHYLELPIFLKLNTELIETKV